MTILPGPGPFAAGTFLESDTSTNVAANFGKLVQKIVQSNSGKHKALVPVPRLEREDSWAEYRTMAERTQSAGNFAHAEAMWLKAIFETHCFDEDDWRRAYSLDCLAILYYAQNRLDEAEVFAERALDATRLSYGKDHLKTAECEMFLGSICFTLGKIDEAANHVKASLAIYEYVLEPVHAKIATACLNLAYIHHARGAFAEAEPFYQRAFKIRAQVFGWEHEMTSRVSKSYAEMAIDRKYHQEAKEMLDRLIGPVPNAPAA
jgi:tetratricopeptide (TPR) repeat protein